MTLGSPPRGAAGPYRTRTFEDERGSMVLEVRSPQLVVTRASGLARQPMVEFYLREFHPFAVAATSKIDVFHDWADVTSFEPGARQAFLSWAEERRELNRRLMRGVHILAGSSVVFLALGAARVLYGAQLDVYRLRSSWQDALVSATRGPSLEPVR